MEDSSFYQYDNGLYYITSYKAKYDVYHMSSVIKFNLAFDLITILFYSAFYCEFLATLPILWKSQIQPITSLHLSISYNHINHYKYLSFFNCESSLAKSRLYHKYAHYFLVSLYTLALHHQNKET